jgi:predicted Zn-dependent protease
MTLADAGDASPVEYVQKLATTGKIASFDGQRESIGGCPSWIGHVTVQKSDGTTGVLCATFLRDGPRTFEILGANAGGDSPLFAAMRSFRKVTDPARLAVQPTRLQVVTVPRSDAFTAVVQGFGPQAIAIGPESILNNVEPDDPVAAGTLLKLVPKLAH